LGRLVLGRLVLGRCSDISM